NPLHITAIRSHSSFSYPVTHRALHSFPTRRSSDLVALGAGAEDGAELGAEHFRLREAEPDRAPAQKRVHLLRELQVRGKLVAARSEEHTSELQSPYDLVCRLLLEKKKNMELMKRFQ